MVLVEVKKDSRSYFFYMPVGAPYGDAIDAAYLVAKDIKEMHDIAEDRRKKEQEEPAKEEETKEDSTE